MHVFRRDICNTVNTFPNLRGRLYTHSAFEISTPLNAM